MTRALIVDDREESAYLLQCLLSAHGFEITTAANGQQALHSAEISPPDLVISDILMPIMDGFTFCRQWRQDTRFSSIPFIFYTATYTDAKDEAFALNLGADLFLVKPQAPDELVRIIKGFMQNRRKSEFCRRAEDLPEEADYLQTYNSVLVRKLESKVFQLEEAKKNLELLNFAISTSIAGIVMWNATGEITYVNQAFSDMCGWESAELMKKPISVLDCDKQDFSKITKMLLTKGQWIGELEVTGKGGTRFTAHIAAHTVFSPKHEPICLMASCLDITEHKRLREELQRTQNLEALSFFAAGVAHDFNNLLTGLFNNLELAQEQLPPNSSAQKQFAAAMSIFERARALSQNLLTFSKGEKAARKILNPASILEESCMLSLSGSGVHFAIVGDGQQEMVEANANQLSRVFTNIILNARQAMNESGNLTIAISSRRLKTNQIGGLPGGSYIRITFEDNGPGIPEHLLPRIFDPFFSTKAEGSGLGLATSYSIIRGHGGHIQAMSQPGKGAAFEIWLPSCKKENADVHEKRDASRATGSGRILIMDDEEYIKNIAHIMLSRAGYEVACASNGEEAVSLYIHELSANKPFDLVILDITIRGGTGGEETLSKMLKIFPGIAAIASTGYSTSADMLRLKKCGFAATLPKPYSRHELLSIVKSALPAKTTIQKNSSSGD